MAEIIKHKSSMRSSTNSSGDASIMESHRVRFAWNSSTSLKSKKATKTEESSGKSLKQLSQPPLAKKNSFVSSRSRTGTMIEISSTGQTAASSHKRLSSTMSIPDKKNQTKLSQLISQKESSQEISEKNHINASISKISDETLRSEIENILATHNLSDREMRESLKKLRNLILKNGLPSDAGFAPDPTRCSLRGRVWKVLLGIYKVSALEYVTLVERGKCDVFHKIKNDTFRTLATNKKFTEKVSEAMIVRVLSSFVWKAAEHPPSRLMKLKYSYVQGMNVLAAPFLYTMPELDAFYSFINFIQHTCPLYVQPALEGVHCGLALMTSCMKIVDPELHCYLRSKNLPTKVYAFP
ncbi:hypothetical protein HK096_005856, partial [Nowakowskiella sp. JEL0078]